MKKHLARVLRRAANRIDPPPKATLWPSTNYTSTATNATIHWR